MRFHIQEEAFLHLFASVALALFLLLTTFLLTACGNAFRRYIRLQPKSRAKALAPFLGFRWVANTLFPHQQTEFTNFSLILTTNIARFCLGIVQVLLIINLMHFMFHIDQVESLYHQGVLGGASLLFVTVLLTSVIIGDLIPRALGTRFAKQTLDYLAPITAFFLIIVSPLSFLFFKIPFKMIRSFTEDLTSGTRLTAEQMISILEEVTQQTELESIDRKLVESVITFRDRIVREVMVPRVKLAALPAETTIREAAQFIEKEGYSRTPVYRNHIDHIIGVLMSKDLLAQYRLYENMGNDAKVLNTPISTLTKSALYTPETKKISTLLQEFRAKQVHLAIVVDEYGGTEGIITIEDILEQLVGEIEDEYDQDEALCIPLSADKWIVDARVGILDAEEQIGIKIPQEGEYDTVGGYIFHRMGCIPEKGLLIHHNDFEMEILSSNQRCVEKVRLKLLNPPPDSESNP